MSAVCSLDDVLAVLPPGEECHYTDLIERLKASGRSTVGVGLVLRPFQEDEWYSGYGERRGELRCWLRDRMWDDEVEGGWIATGLWIARRAASLDSQESR